MRELKPVHARAIWLLGTGRPVGRVARTLGVTRFTVSRWKSAANFAQALKAFQRQIEAAVVARVVQRLMGGAFAPARVCPRCGATVGAPPPARNPEPH